jgi:hypothetical protein
MPSSPAEQSLQAILFGYDRAILALRDDDLACVERMLDDVERRLRVLPPASGELREKELRLKAQEHHRRLVEAITAARDALVPHVRQVRNGLRALRGYRPYGPQGGERFDGDG